MQHEWFKNAVFYSLDVETFYDAHGDGIGDFPGLLQKLDYIAALGATCIWLLPFYPSPNRDNGYDVKDYCGVDARLGEAGDFVQFMNKAGSLGLRVIIDLVVNHTSIEHPWFQQARKSKASRYHDFYVWADKPLPYKQEQLLFTGEEHSVWTFDDAAGKYYLHHFYGEQPDLNIANPAVREEILSIMGFWLRLGVSGFRIDAAEILIDSYGIKGAEGQDFSFFLNEMRDFVTAQKPDAILLAEANVPPPEMNIYLNDGRRMHMLFNFFVNQHLFLSLAEEKPAVFIKALQSLPPLRTSNQWVNFLRHHDELTLSLLNDEQRSKVFQRFAPDKNMRIYERGIRRRLAPMINGNRRLLEFCYSLLFSLPGIPLIRYGDEIGMGENLDLKGRTSVRTPMQWSRERNGGFSAADENLLVHPVINDDEYGYQKVNVMDAQRAPGSLLNWMERLITVRKQSPAIGLGELQVLSSGNDSVLIHAFEWQGETFCFLHNFSAQNAAVQIPFSSPLFPLFENEGSNGTLSEIIQLEGYGYKWLRIKNET